MISRYALHTIADLRDRFSLDEGLPKGIKSQYNVHPTAQAPVIVNQDGHLRVHPMRWGLAPKGTTNTNSVFRYKTYNTASEKILSKHSWDTAVRHSRCLVPSNGFYFLNEGSDRRAHYVQLKSTSLFAFAGIYSSWKDDNGEYSTYSLITIEAPESLQNITQRMPIIIDQSNEAKWLDTSITDANTLFDMLRPTAIDQLTIDEVSTDIYSLKINTPKLIIPRTHSL